MVKISEGAGPGSARQGDGLRAQVDVLMDVGSGLLFVLRGAEVVQCNTAAAEALGVAVAAEAYGRPLSAWVPPSHWPAWEEALAQLAAGAISARLTGEVLGLTRATRIEVDVWLERIAWGGGEDEAILIVCRDVGVTRRTREKLHESGARLTVLEAIASDAPLPEVMQAVALMVERGHKGLRAAALLVDPGGETISAVAAPSLPPAVLTVSQRMSMGPDGSPCVAAASSGVRSLIDDISHLDTTPGLIEALEGTGVRGVWTEPIASSQGRVYGALVIFYIHPRVPEPWDVEFIQAAAQVAAIAVERARTNEALRLSEARFRTLFEYAPEAIVVYDAERRRIVDCNPQAELVLRRPRHELANASPFGMLPEFQANGQRSTETLGAFTEQLLRGEPVELSWSILAPDEALIPLEVTLIRLPGEGLVLRALIRDQTERLRAEQEREQLEAELRHKSRLSELGMLASGVAHEINNPIQGILGFAELIGARTAEGDVLHTWATRIQHEAERMALIVRDLLTFARREQASPLQLESFNEIIRSSLALLERQLQQDGVLLTLDLDAALPDVLGRGTQLRQVLVNLLTNARDALNERWPSTQEGKRLTIRTRQREAQGQRWARVEVEDNGCGIPDEVQARIFEPFFTTKQLELSTGMGLPISFGIVAEHGGHLTVESTPGEFTRFTLEIAAVDAGAPDVK